MEASIFFNINFNRSENKFLSLAYVSRNYVAILDKFNTNRMSIHFMLLYRKQSIQIKQFFQMLHYLVATFSIDIIAADFNYDLLKI